MGLFKKGNSSVADAYNDLVNRQRMLIWKKKQYEASLSKLRNTLDDAIAAENTSAEAIVRKQIDNMKDRIKDLDDEYDRNTKNISNYSTDRKNLSETGARWASVLVSAATGGACVWLGNSAKNMSWTSDMTGEPMQNKQTKDMFKLFLSWLSSPMRMFMK